MRAADLPALRGKRVAVTGATGGLGRELCRRLAGMGASLVLMDRNPEKSAALEKRLTAEFPSLTVERIPVDLERMESVRTACDRLRHSPPDIFIHNAGAYAIPRRITDAGVDNVFQIDFLSPYYMTRELLPALRERGGHVVVVGSIAHRYSRTDPDDVDFSTRRRCNLVYGNAKRYLMFAMYELFARETSVTLAVAHPGISFTNITAHYPKWLFWLIREPMKWIFMPPRRACESIVEAAQTTCDTDEWIGPRWFDVWGAPRKSRLHSCPPEERRRIGETADLLYERLKENEIIQNV